MPKILVTETAVIEKYGINEKVGRFDTGADYVICQSDVLDSVYESELTERGFRFLDRILYMEIDLAKKNISADNGPKRILQDQGIVFACDGVFTESMYQMAYKAYTSDRRFHLNPVFSQQDAIPVIRAYIDQCRLGHMKIYKALHQDELLGYAVIDETADGKKCYFENVLGVTAPGIKGKMVAEALYGSVLTGEKSSFKKYAGRVSSSNMVSINLHFQLGAKVRGIYDEYIYKIQ